MADTPLSAAARRNIVAVRDLATEVRRRRTRLDRITDAMSGFAGSPRFLAAQAAAVLGWVGLNTGAVPGARPFDPFPFEFLNFVLAVEAILLATVVLMTQNRQGREAAEQAELHLQIGLLAEQEATKILEMLQALHGRLGLHAAAADRELGEMIRTTQVEVLSGELKRSREEYDGTPGGDVS
ncbi:MAG TPA: DUF1003 domain-containing protein [Urbifossiella sp.]|nr:DUF1003 domain-containing protein [Urbifossiella sp.]